MLLYEQAYRLKVHDIEFTELDIEFTVTKTLKKTPNTLELTIYNLTEEHRRRLEKAVNPVVTLEAGYKNNIALIFQGIMRDVHSSYRPPDWVTELGGGDGERTLRIARINKSYSPGVEVSSVMSDLVKSMGLKPGNLRQQLKGAKLLGGSSQFLNGAVLSGQAAKELDRLATSLGFTWSIQNESLQLLKLGAALNKAAVVLSPSTGLLGSPSMGDGGVVTIEALLNPDITPGKQIALRSKTLNGYFIANKVEYKGTYGGSWLCSIEAKEART